jgi:predicted nucleic acid-binding protein
LPIKVVDASALGAILFGEPDAGKIALRLEGASLAAPALLPFEVGNLCLMKIRRHPGLRAPLLAAFSLMKRLEIDTVEIDYAEALRLAETAALTFYDASYLWLAKTLGAELVTLDLDLEAASKAS